MGNPSGFERTVKRRYGTWLSNKTICAMEGRFPTVDEAEEDERLDKRNRWVWDPNVKRMVVKFMSTAQQKQYDAWAEKFEQDQLDELVDKTLEDVCETFLWDPKLYEKVYMMKEELRNVRQRRIQGTGKETSAADRPVSQNIRGVGRRDQEQATGTANADWDRAVGQTDLGRSQTGANGARGQAGRREDVPGPVHGLQHGEEGDPGPVPFPGDDQVSASREDFLPCV